MRSSLRALHLAIAVAISGSACTKTHWYPSDEYTLDAYPSWWECDAGVPHRMPGDAEVAPWCTTLVTREGTVCVSCAIGSTSPVVSCSKEPPAQPSTCDHVTVEDFVCEVCYDPRGHLISQSCDHVTPDGCRTELVGEELCLACSVSNHETYRKCQPKSRQCTASSSPTEVCIQCTTASGKVLSRQCFPSSRECAGETEGERICLVCRDGAGKVLSRDCADAAVAADEDSHAPKDAGVPDTL